MLSSNFNQSSRFVVAFLSSVLAIKAYNHFFNPPEQQSTSYVSVSKILESAQNFEIISVIIGEEKITAFCHSGQIQEAYIPDGMNAFEELKNTGIEIFAVPQQSKIETLIKGINPYSILKNHWDQLILGMTVFAGVFYIDPKIKRSFDHAIYRFKKPDEEKNKRIAYHEAGHALLMILCPNDREIKEATIVASSFFAGAVISIRKKEFSRKSALDYLTMAFGGRCAEEIIFGADAGKSYGAIADLEMITSTAEQMVMMYSMSNDTSPVNYEMLKKSNVLDEDTKRKLVNSIENLCTEAKDRATKMLIEHRSQLDTLAQALLEHRTLKAEEIYKTIGMRPEQFMKNPNLLPQTDESSTFSL